MPHHRRVVITGLGIISPVGSTQESFWQGLTCGRSAIRAISRFDTSEMPVHSGGEIPAEFITGKLPGNNQDRVDFTTLLGGLAVGQALEDAGLTEAARENLRVGLVVGSGMGPCHTAEESYNSYFTRGWKGLRPTVVPKTMFNVLAGEISMRFHLTGGHNVVAAACASGAVAMTQAYDSILCGRENVAICGGADSPLCVSMYGAWVNLRVLSKNPDPAVACRPFDVKRDGMVLAEGAGMVALEELEHARARGAKIYAEIIGAGVSSDASHVTKPTPIGQAAAIQQALDSAGLRPEDVDYINAHGTATLLNDVTETASIKMVFGEHARHVPISSTKSVLGHAMGASGALELIACVLAIRHQILPPTVNLDEPDPLCDLDYVPKVARPARVRTALSNSFAFGGSNSVLAIRAFEG